MSPPTLLQVLRALRSTRLDLQWRPVLHDMLIERYGDDYEHHLDSAHVHAHRDGKPYAVFVSPTHLIDREHGRPERPASRYFARSRLTRQPSDPFRVLPAIVNIAHQKGTVPWRRAVVSYVAFPGGDLPEGRAYYLRGWGPRT